MIAIIKGNTQKINRDLFLKNMVYVRSVHGVTVDIEWDK